MPKGEPMLRITLVVAGVAVVAVFMYARQCDEGHGLTEAQLQNVACRDILGGWDLYLNSDGSSALGKGMLATGASVMFSADRNGRFMNMASDDKYWEGLRGCERFGSTYDLHLRYNSYRYEEGSQGELRGTVTGSSTHVVSFEMTSPDELRQIDGGSMSFVFRRNRSVCAG